MIRIGKWKAFKNLKAWEKEELSKLQVSNLHSGQNLEIGSKPVKWHLVQRHVRERNRTTGLQQNRSAQVSKVRLDTESRQLILRNHQPAPVLPCTSDPVKALVDPVEISLLHARSFFRWDIAEATFYRQSRREVEKQTAASILGGSAMEPWINFANSREFLETSRPHLAYRLINRGCDLLRTSVKQRPLIVLFQLYEFSTARTWDRHSRLRTMILDFLKATVMYVLEPSHPLRALVQSCSFDGNAKNLVRSLLRLTSDVYQAQAPNMRCELWMELAARLSDLGEFGDSMRIAQLVARDEDATIGYRIKTRRMLGRAFGRQGRVQEAIDGLLKVLRESNTASTVRDKYVKIQQAYTLEFLGFLYGQIQDDRESALCYQQAFELFLGIWGLDDPFTLSVYEDLNKVLQSLGRMEEREALQQKYPSLFNDNILEVPGRSQGPQLVDAHPAL